MSITVFLADDHTVVREGLRALLETQEDIEVVGEATNGRDATTLGIELCPDVAILDIAMPALNGIEVALRLRARRPFTRIIIMSMYSTHEHVSRALGAGAEGYLLKESAGAEIIEAVRSVQKGHRFLSQKISDIVIEDYSNPSGGIDATSPLARLSLREREILQLVVEGRSSVDIAEIINVSSKTVDTYRSRLMRKLKIKDIPTLVKFALRCGVISLE